MKYTVKEEILNTARRLGFTLAGVTTPDPPEHIIIFEKWLAQNRHGEMAYLARESARLRRSNPRSILPECKSILVLATPYDRPLPPGKRSEINGRVAAYAWGQDYHEVLPQRMRLLVEFIEKLAGTPVPNRWYTDTGPILERNLAQRAGLGWIGKNTCLIHPRQGSYFLLAEILLGLELEPNPPFTTDQCGTCTRCIDACPTDCILSDRTIDARRCISFLTIELKDEIPEELRTQMNDWVFGCDICQMVCPWNRFSPKNGDPAFSPTPENQLPVLSNEVALIPDNFNRRFKHSPIKRAKRRGYIRNAVIALGNTGDPSSLPALESALNDPDGMIRECARWAIDKIKHQYRTRQNEKNTPGNK